MAYSPPRLAMLDTTSQTIAISGTAQVITFNTTDSASKITVTSSSRFTIKEPGRYLIIGKAQINLVSGTNKFINIWARKNGSDVTTTNARFGVMTASSDASVPILGYVDCVADDYLEIWMVGDSDQLQIANVASGGGAPTTNSINLVILKSS